MPPWSIGKRNVGVLASGIALILCPGPPLRAAQITDAAAAVEAAKNLTRGRCNTQTPCTFRARREGKQWNVMVQPKRNAAGKPGPLDRSGYLMLYFDAEGNLVRRVERE